MAIGAQGMFQGLFLPSISCGKWKVQAASQGHILILNATTPTKERTKFVSCFEECTRVGKCLGKLI
jgi:hypothetical protein